MKIVNCIMKKSQKINYTEYFKTHTQDHKTYTYKRLYESWRKNEYAKLRYLCPREVPKFGAFIGYHGNGKSDLIGHRIFLTRKHKQSNVDTKLSSVALSYGFGFTMCTCPLVTSRKGLFGHKRPHTNALYPLSPPILRVFPAILINCFGFL